MYITSLWRAYVATRKLHMYCTCTYTGQSIAQVASEKQPRMLRDWRMYMYVCMHVSICLYFYTTTTSSAFYTHTPPPRPVSCMSACTYTCIFFCNLCIVEPTYTHRPARKDGMRNRTGVMRSAARPAVSFLFIHLPPPPPQKIPETNKGPT